MRYYVFLSDFLKNDKIRCLPLFATLVLSYYFSGLLGKLIENLFM